MSPDDDVPATAPRQRRFGIHDRLEGTRGLLTGTAVLLIAAMLEPALPPTFPRWVLTIPAMVLLGIGLGTLPREGLAARERSLLLADGDEARPILRRLVWLGGAVVLLLPRLFLGAYGIPHLNPLVGIVPQQWVIRVATVFLFFALLLPVLYLRAIRYGAVWPRHADVHDGDPSVRMRDTLLVGLGLLLVLWGLLLKPFWAPFSLLQWPPELWSLDAGARGVAALAFALLPPAVLFMALSAQVAVLRRLVHQPRSPGRDGCLAATGLHVALILTAAFLHGYDLLWIARYESLAQF